MKGTTNAMTIGGTIGTDTKPVKIVNGEAVAVSTDLAQVASPVTTDLTTVFANAGVSAENVTRMIFGPLVIFSFRALTISAALNTQINGVFPANYTPIGDARVSVQSVNTGVYCGEIYTFGGGLHVEQRTSQTGSYYGMLIVPCTIN